MVIIRVKEHNRYVLYRRQRGKETSVPLYVIMKDGVMVEEFRHIGKAINRFTLYSKYGVVPNTIRG